MSFASGGAPAYRARYSAAQPLIVNVRLNSQRRKWPRQTIFFGSPQDVMKTAVNSAIRKSAIAAPHALNEAYCYSKPVPFSRGMRVETPGAVFLFISGTASVNEEGKSIHVGDIEAQCWRTFRNIQALLESEGASWKDVVRTTCYLRDIERDYEVFNKVRKAFYDEQELDPYPASTGVQAILCRPELLVEIEAIAVIPAHENGDFTR